MTLYELSNISALYNPSSPLTTVTVSYPTKFIDAPFIGLPFSSVMVPLTWCLANCVRMKSTVMLSPSLSVTCSTPIEVPLMYFAVTSYSPIGMPLMVYLPSLLV